MRGYLVLADISGYTRFLSESELEHANGIIGELLESILAAIDAPLEVSRIEGDAVFMYGTPPEGMIGETLLETVEQLYLSFARALETMVLNTTCSCNACVNINALGLKIVMHCGEFAVTKVGGIQTLSGTDVIVAHRLLKNRVREETGIDDYLFASEACVADLGIGHIVSGWIPHDETYEDVGAVGGYVTSLADAWNAAKAESDHVVTEDQAWLRSEVATTAPPAVVWDHLLDARKRTAWLDAHRNEVVADGTGRMGPGAEFHCVHGPENEVLVFTVLGRQPLQHMTLSFPVGEGLAIRYTDHLVPSDGGTTVISCAAPVASTETGEPIDAERLADYEPMFLGYVDSLNRMAEMVARVAG
ncbi:MAG: DUF2652 domain-containing protein [Acidimicrobiia bacterium]